MNLSNTPSKFAGFSSLDVETNLGFQFFETKERLIFLGQWLFGTPATDNSFPALQQFTHPVGEKDKTILADVQQANGVIAWAPKKAFDAFAGAREINVWLLKQAKSFADKGYNPAASCDAMTKPVTKALANLQGHALHLKSVSDRLDAAQATVAEALLSVGAGEQVFDLAIAQKHGSLNIAEASTIRNGDLPPKFMDRRCVAAFARVPACLHDIAAESLEKIFSLSNAATFPCTTQTVQTVRQMVADAARAIASAAVTAEVAAGLPTGTAFQGDLSWLSAYRSSVATSGDDFKNATMNARFPDGMPGQQLPALQDA